MEPSPPVAVETQTVHHAASAEGKGVAGLVDDAHKRVGAWDPRQAVLRTVAAMHKVCQVALQERGGGSGPTDSSVKIRPSQAEKTG